MRTACGDRPSRVGPAGPFRARARADTDEDLTRSLERPHLVPAAVFDNEHSLPLPRAAIVWPTSPETAVSFVGLSTTSARPPSGSPSTTAGCSASSAQGRS